MQPFHGTIKKSDKVILEDIDVWITVIKPPLGAQEWRGNFKASPGQIQMGSQYKLILEDGRSGEILVKNLEIRNSGPMFVHFIGTGPLD